MNKDFSKDTVNFSKVVSDPIHFVSSPREMIVDTVIRYGVLDINANYVESSKERIANAYSNRYTSQKAFGKFLCEMFCKNGYSPVNIGIDDWTPYKPFKLLYNQGIITTIMNSAGFGTPQGATLPSSMITTIEDCGFFESIPLWAVTLIGGLFITVLSFIMIMTVYGRFFKLYMYAALAPIPLSTFAGEPSQNVGKSFIKSYCAVLLEGAVIVLACIIFSVFASSPPTVDTSAAAVTQVWAYIGELIFNMLVLVGSVKMSDRIIREMMGL